MKKDSQNQVAYAYDDIGRMMTRTEYVSGVAQNPTKFEWDDWDLVRETAPDGTATGYYQPFGELMTFERGSALYQSLNRRCFWGDPVSG
ncbi:MAG: hypothetical protein HY319_01185 [Armatimonadetes bacterium]|nr:hypothetical protein [Armatimonadota bacterium]